MTADSGYGRRYGHHSYRFGPTPDESDHWTIVPVTYRKVDPKTGVEERRELDYWITGIDSVLRGFYADDPGRYVAQLHARLAADVPSREQFAAKAQDRTAKFHAELEVHAALLAALEWLFAQLAAHENTPDCPPAWLLKYEQAELRTFARELGDSGRHCRRPQSGQEGPREPVFPSWRTRMTHLFGETEPPRSDDELEETGRVLGRLSTRLLEGTDELNGHKHGLRLRASFYAVGFGGPEIVDFGTHFFQREAIDNSKGHFHLTQRSSSFHPETEVDSLAMVARLLTALHLQGRHRMALGTQVAKRIVDPDAHVALMPRNRMIGFGMRLSPPQCDDVLAFVRWRNQDREKPPGQ